MHLLEVLMNPATYPLNLRLKLPVVRSEAVNLVFYPLHLGRDYSVELLCEGAVLLHNEVFDGGNEA